MFSFLLVEGRMRDARMLAVSQLHDDLQNFAFDPVGRAMCLYGDPAHPLRVHLQAPFRVGILTRDIEKMGTIAGVCQVERNIIEWTDYVWNHRLGFIETKF